MIVTDEMVKRAAIVDLIHIEGEITEANRRLYYERFSEEIRMQHEKEIREILEAAIGPIDATL